jgi:hypothetical protein
MVDDLSNSVETLCKSCGAQAPTKYVEFYQNIGLVVARQWSKVDGNLCRRCIGAYFRSYTLTTLFLGWWGLISFFATPLILLNNVTRYLLSLSLPEPGPAAMNTPLAATGLTPSVSTHSRAFKWVYGGTVCVGVLVFIAYQSVEFMEKHAPRLNAAMHGGEISGDSDGEYSGMQIGKDLKALAAPYKGQNWGAIRSEVLSREQFLDDLKQQNEKFQQRKGIEKNANLGSNDVCESIALDEFLPALNNYASVLTAEFSLIKATPEATKAATTSLGTLSKEEDDARKQLAAYFDDSTAKGCDK